MRSDSMDFYCEEKAEAAAIEKLEELKNHRNNEMRKLGGAYEALKCTDLVDKVVKELSAQKTSHMYNRWLNTSRYCLADDEIRRALLTLMKEEQYKKDRDQSRFSRII